MGSSTLGRKHSVGTLFLMKIVLLLSILVFQSCAFRYKGIKGIESSGPKSVGFTDATIVKLPEYYRNYNKGEDKVTPRLFNKDPASTWIVQEINYKQVPFGPMCGTGLVLPMLVSWASLGIIPISLTDELKGHAVIKHRETNEVRHINFHAKRTSSYSLWNKLKIGKDPEWTGKDKMNNDEYYRKFLESKMPN